MRGVVPVVADDWSWQTAAMRRQVDRSHARGPIARAGRQPRSCVVGVLVGLVVLASCSSSGEEADTTVVSSPSTAPTTTEASTTTSTSTTTTSTSIAETSTTAETTTTSEAESVVDTVPTSEPVPTDDSIPADTTPLEIPTDTVYAPDSIEGEVEQTVLGFYASFVRCLEQLPNCDVSQVAEFMALDFGEGNTTLIDGWNALGSSARNTQTLEYEVVGVDEFSEDNNEAIVTICTSTEVDIFIPAEADRPEEETFGVPESTIARFLIQKLGDNWFVTASEEVEKIFGEGSDLCS